MLHRMGHTAAASVKTVWAGLQPAKCMIGASSRDESTAGLNGWLAGLSGPECIPCM